MRTEQKKQTRKKEKRAKKRKQERREGDPIDALAVVVVGGFASPGLQVHHLQQRK
jgi:hypothetical protein